MSSIAPTGVQTAWTSRSHKVSAAATSLRAAIEHWLDAERHQLPLWMPVLVGIGIAGYFLLPWRLQWGATGCAALGLCFAGLAVSGLLGRVLRVGGLLILTGLLLAYVRAESVAAPRAENRQVVTLAARVLAVEDRAAEGKWRLILVPETAGLPAVEGVWAEKVRLTLRRIPDPAIRPGARISLRAALSPPAGPVYPGGYDFARRAWFDGIGATAIPLGPIHLLEPAPDSGMFLARIEVWRTALTARLREEIRGNAGGIAAALVTGDRGGIDRETADAMADSGLAHLLSISGLHIAAVVGAVMLVVRRGLLLSPWLALHWPTKAVAALAAALAAIFYTLLAGASVPTVRACIATIIVLAGILAGREAISLRLVAMAAMLVLIFRPEALLGPSFQLSFAAVTGLIAFYESRHGQAFMRSRPDLGGAARAGRWLLALLLSGIVAEAVLAPTAIFHFNRSGLFGMIANMVAIPLTTFVIMPLLGLALLLDPLGLAAPIHAGLGLAIDTLIALARWTQSLPGAVLRLPATPTWAYGMIVLGGLWLMLWRTRPRLIGLLPLAAGLMGMALAKPADLVISDDGRHVALMRDGRLALLRPQTGSYMRDMLGDAAGVTAATRFEQAGARCSPDSCLADIRGERRVWRLMATRSRYLIDRAAMQPSCDASDIVVSDRRLPRWCKGRWLTLDRVALAESGAMAIWLSPVRLRSVREAHGDHPWATTAKVTKFGGQAAR